MPSNGGKKTEQSHDGQTVVAASGRQRGADLSEVAPGDVDAVGGGGEVQPGRDVDWATGPTGFHARLIGGVVTLETEQRQETGPSYLSQHADGYF